MHFLSLHLFKGFIVKQQPWSHAWLLRQAADVMKPQKCNYALISCAVFRMELCRCEHTRFQISCAGLNTRQTRNNQAKSRLNVHQVMPKTRREARAKRRENYLAGQARRPHTHSRTLGVALDESSSSMETGICCQCYAVLTRYSTVFKEVIHQGTELKKRKRINATPKRLEAEFTHYRNITRQHEWLLVNVFDSMGNYFVLQHLHTTWFEGFKRQAYKTTQS